MNREEFMQLMANAAHDFWNQELDYCADALSDGEEIARPSERSQAALCCEFADFLKAYNEPDGSASRA